MGLKAMFFTGDALIAAFLILGGLLAAASFYVHESSQQDVNFIAQDITNIMNDIKVGEINNSYVKQLIAQGNITKLNNSLLEQVGVFWAEDHSQLAASFLQNTIGPLIPSALSLAVYADSQPVYLLNRSTQSSVAVFRKFVSGIEHDKPIQGYTARLYLKGIDSRHTSGFAYFGGFIGQGNITEKLWLADNLSSVSDVYLELADSGTFSLYINGVYIASYAKGSGGGSYLVPDSWNITTATQAKFHSGYNTIGLKFGSLAYIAGGFLRVTYNTKTIADSNIVYKNNSASSHYYFPGVKGVINIYDSLTIPGTLKSMKVHLKYKSSFPTYLTIGSKIVYQGSGSAVNQSVNLVNMSSFPYSLNFAQLSNSTVPIRFAAYNLSTSNISGKNGDVILITDLSGSMAYTLGSWDATNGIIRVCNSTKTYTNSTTRRISLAKCLDINFTDSIMSQQGNREWLVDFSDDAHYFSNVLSDLTKLNLINQIKSYSNTPAGGTCLCCSINLAYNILNSYTTSNRTKFVVILTDGVPGYCCGSSGGKCTNGSSTTWQFQPNNCLGDQDDCNSNDCNNARNNAIWSAKRLVNQFKAKIYTVGMGPIVNCRQANITLHRIAQVGNGTYNASMNGTQLRGVFRTIASKVLAQVNRSNQQLIVRGNLSPSTLFEESYIETNYTPIEPTIGYGNIMITSETQRFGNALSTKRLYFPSSTRLLNLIATSYSEDKWTDNVSITNGSKYIQVFSLGNIFVDYTRLGDPFTVMVPSNKFKYNINNTVRVRTGQAPGNASGGSSYDKLIYTISVENSVGYSGVYANKAGCSWALRFDDGTNATVKVPSTYNGTKRCKYYPANFSFDDAYDNAAYTLFSYLDFDRDGRLSVKIGGSNVEPEARDIDEVPSMWGPSIIEVRVWK